MTGSTSTPRGGSSKWPAGHTRVGSSTTRGRMRRARRTRSWSGSASSTTSKTVRGTSRLRRVRSCASGSRCRSSIGSRTTGRAEGADAAQVGLGQGGELRRNQWAALRRYTTDGRLTIDNNVSERTLRLQAIGRKNWEFLGSAEAGPRAVVLFTYRPVFLTKHDGEKPNFGSLRREPSAYCR